MPEPNITIDGKKTIAVVRTKTVLVNRTVKYKGVNYNHVLIIPSDSSGNAIGGGTRYFVKLTAI